MRLDNRGQSLVLFVILMPIFLGMMVLVIDMGNVICYKQKMNHINEIVLEYGVQNQDKIDVVKEMKELARYNLVDIKVDIQQSTSSFWVSSSFYVKGIFSRIFDTDGYLVVSVSEKDKNQGEMDRIQ